MTENYSPCVAKITCLIMVFGLLCTVGIFAWFGLVIYPIWAVCVGLLFLCEYLFKRKSRKLFTTNIGAFIAIAAEVVTFAVWMAIESAAHTRGILDFFELEQQLYCLSFLPPIIVSLIANVCNIIYKVKEEKADNPSDGEP